LQIWRGQGRRERALLPPDKVNGKVPELPKDWAPHADFIEQWRKLDPLFDSAEKLRPACSSVVT
jgi:predicted secreted hydrolase